MKPRLLLNPQGTSRWEVKRIWILSTTDVHKIDHLGDSCANEFEERAKIKADWNILLKWKWGIAIKCIAGWLQMEQAWERNRLLISDVRKGWVRKLSGTVSRIGKREKLKLKILLKDETYNPSVR